MRAGATWFWASGLAVAAVCAAPVAWLTLQAALSPGVWAGLIPDGHQGMLLLRTLGLNGLAAAVAVALAAPVAWSMARGGRARLLWVVAPPLLLLPAVAVGYAWTQAFRLAGWTARPGSAAEALRCAWTIAAWLWPGAALVLALALRRLEVEVEEQALIDGAGRRVLARRMAPAALVAGAAVMLLAMQEASIYEAAGVSVVATEARMVFETGALSSAARPLGALAGGAAAPEGQSARIGAAVAVSLPAVACTAALTALLLRWAGRLQAERGMGHGATPASLSTPPWARAIAWGVVAGTVALPLAALAASWRRVADPDELYATFAPRLGGSGLLAAATATGAAWIGVGAMMRRRAWVAWAAVAGLAAGGQWLAIGLIRLYNRPETAWVYDSAAIVVMACLGRFTWLTIWAAQATWTGPWRALREQAAIDGAGEWQTAWRVVLPPAAPVLAAAALVAGALAVGESSAIMLLMPLEPPLLTPLMMTWAHLQRFDPMIEACLLLTGAAALLGVAATLLGGAGLRRWRGLAVAPLLLGMVGCREPDAPEAIWASTGRGPAQVIYPRGIAYDPADDAFVVVDRAARIQRLDSGGRFVSGWSTPESEQGMPVGISVGPDGRIYVPDTHYHRVLVYAPDGSLLRQWGGRGDGPGQFIYPTDIAFDASGRVYVSEYGDHDRIQVFDADGAYLREIGRFGSGDGEFSRPQSILILEDELYVADACNHRIVVFGLDGAFRRAFGRSGAGPGELRFPYGLDVDAEGALIVCEFGNNRVQRLDRRTGRPLGAWGGPGRRPGELAYPWAVAVDRRGRIVTVDAGNNRLQVFRF